MIEILATGPVNTVQDFGRLGLRSLGISTNGAMDPLSMSAANLLAGNPANAAALEIQSFPLRLKFLSRTRFAVTGAASAMMIDGRELPSNWSMVAELGQELEISSPSHGARCYLALGGGVDLPEVLGSRSTHLNGKFGGIDGRAIRVGDHINAGKSSAEHDWEGGVTSPLVFAGKGFASGDPLALRVVAGADYELFPKDRRDAFWSTEWRITPQSNRAGYRLRGASLSLPEPVSLYSYGLVPGIVQVPPSGEPIIQMADANTAGGYPRIGGVIEADLWKLGQARIGSMLSFERVDFATAAAATSEHDTYLAGVKQAIRVHST